MLLGQMALIGFTLLRLIGVKFWRSYIGGCKHLDIVPTRAKIHYLWPRMKEDVKSHVSPCKSCFTHKPSTSEAEHRALSIPIEDLSPMD